MSLLSASRATRSTKTGTKFRTGEPLMSLRHHGTHPFLRGIWKLFTEPFDDLIQLPNLMGGGVLHDVIIAGWARLTRAAALGNRVRVEPRNLV